MSEVNLDDYLTEAEKADQLLPDREFAAKLRWEFERGILDAYDPEWIVVNAEMVENQWRQACRFEGDEGLADLVTRGNLPDLARGKSL